MLHLSHAVVLLASVLTAALDDISRKLKQTFYTVVHKNVPLLFFL